MARGGARGRAALGARAGRRPARGAGRAQPRERGAALARWCWRGSSAGRPWRRSPASPAPTGGSRWSARARHRRSSTTTATTRRSSARRSRPRGRRRGAAGVVAVYQPHVVERTRQLHRELGEALGLADVAIVTDVDGRRDAPRDGVDRRLVLDGVPAPTRAAVGADARRRGEPRAPRRPRRVTSSSRSGSASRGRPRGRSSRGSPA